MYLPNGIRANHLPFELNPKVGENGYLLAHVARADPLWLLQATSRPSTQLTALVGIGIEITQLVGKWKLSQNEEERDRIHLSPRRTQSRPTFPIQPVR